MSKKIVYSGQSFLDKVIENTGSIENAFDMAFLNGLSITDDVEIGKSVESSTITNKAIVGFFTENNRPATGRVTMIDTKIEDYSFPGEFPFSF